MGKDTREDEILRKKGRRSQKRLDLALSKQFNPRFLEDADSRIAVVRLIRKRVEVLRTAAGGDESPQREYLVKRAVFVATLLETQEVKALEGEPLDVGSYTQMVNCLCGLLSRLGLERRARQAGGLAAYVDGKRNGSR